MLQNPSVEVANRNVERKPARQGWRIGPHELPTPAVCQQRTAIYAPCDNTGRGLRPVRHGRRAAPRRARATLAARNGAGSEPILGSCEPILCDAPARHRASMLHWRDFVVAAVSVVCTLGITHFTRLGGVRTSTGRVKSRGDKAFVLMVGLSFRDASSADTLLKAWHEAADYCMTHEPFLCARTCGLHCVRGPKNACQTRSSARSPALATSDSAPRSGQVRVRNSSVGQGPAQLRHL